MICMRSHDGKLDQLKAALPGFSQLSRREQHQLAQEVELVEVRAGSFAARAGLAGRWQTLVVSGVVVTTAPARHYQAGDLILHGPGTAIVALTDAHLATADVRATAFQGHTFSTARRSQRHVTPEPVAADHAPSPS